MSLPVLSDDKVSLSFKRLMKAIPAGDDTFTGMPPYSLFASGPSVAPMIVNGELVDIKIHGMNGFKTDEERQFFINAMKLLAKGIASETFKFRALSAGKKYKHLNGKTPGEAYRLITKGWCQYFKKEDGALDIFIILYSGKAKTIGYTYGFLKVWTNRYHFLSWMEMEKKKKGSGLSHAAGHWFHEHLHCQGFKHPTHAGSLVYEWGYLMRKICFDIANGASSRPVLFL